MPSSSYLERVRTWDQGARARCLEELDTHGVYLFTYVDADDHLPAFHDQPSTDSVAPARAVTEAMAKLPDRTAPVSAAAAKVQHLMNRSSICQVMHVMACVATDRGRLERDLMHRSGAGGVAASMAEYATEVARGDLQHEGPWKELRKPRKVVEEHVSPRREQRTHTQPSTSSPPSYVRSLDRLGQQQKYLTRTSRKKGPSGAFAGAL